MDAARQPRASVGPSTTVEIPVPGGNSLAGLLDLPAGPPKAFALVAHCFVCGMNLHGAAHLTDRLTEAGIGVLRFDFTGIGKSSGEFDQTDFASNVDDLVHAAEWLRREHKAPQVLIGHSLGGSAVLVAAHRIPAVNAVVTIGAPAEAYHVTNQFQPQVREIEANGSAIVQLGVRRFRIGKHLLESLRDTNLLGATTAMAKPLLILHSPLDQVVSIADARLIFDAARHPKSFVALDGADHFLIDPAEALYAGGVIAAWADRYVVDESDMLPRPADGNPVTIAEAHAGSLLNYVTAGKHQSLADEPVSVGGFDAGPSPYDLVSAGLGACTSMTLRLYANRKSMDLQRVRVDVDHQRVHAADCAECVASDGDSPRRLVDTFRRRIHLEGNLDDAQRQQLMRIAEQCPVHRSLSSASTITTELADGDALDRDNGADAQQSKTEAEQDG